MMDIIKNINNNIGKAGWSLLLIISVAVSHSPNERSIIERTKEYKIKQRDLTWKDMTFGLSSNVV